MTLPTQIAADPNDPLAPDLSPEERYEWVLQRLPLKAWRDLESQLMLDSLEESGQTGNPDVDDFFEKLRTGQLKPPPGVVQP